MKHIKLCLLLLIACILTPGPQIVRPQDAPAKKPIDKAFWDKSNAAASIVYAKVVDPADAEKQVVVCKGLFDEYDVTADPKAEGHLTQVLANACYGALRMKEAIPYYKRALELDRKPGSCHLDLARAAMFALDIDTAETSLNWLKDHPGEPGKGWDEWAGRQLKDLKRLGVKGSSISGKDQNGERFSTGSMKDTIVVLDFWATWCGPCKDELPKVKALHKKYETNASVQIVGVSLDEDETKWKNFIKSNDMKYTNYFGGKGWNTAEAKSYKVTSIPKLFVLDGDQRIRYLGRTDGAADMVAYLLKEQEQIKELKNKK